MNFCLGDEYLLPTKFFADGFFTDKVANLSRKYYDEDWIIGWNGLKRVCLSIIDTLYIETS